MVRDVRVRVVRNPAEDLDRNEWRKQGKYGQNEWNVRGRPEGKSDGKTLLEGIFQTQEYAQIGETTEP